MSPERPAEPVRPPWSGLDPTTIALLELAAVVGEELDAADLALLGVAPRDVPARLAPAEAAGVVRRRGRQWCFPDPAVRAALLAGLPASVARDLHRELASGLAAAGAPAVRVAAHARLGARRGDVEAVGWLQEAARAVVRDDPAAAADLLDAAAGLDDRPAAGQSGLSRQRASALVACGRLAEALEVALRGVEDAPGASEDAGLRVVVVDTLVGLGQLDRAREQLARAAATAPSSALRARLLALGLLDLDPGLGDAAVPGLVGPALAAARATGDAWLVAGTLLASAVAVGQRGGAVQAERWCREAAAVGARAGAHAVHRPAAHLLLATALVDQGRAGEAHREVVAAGRLGAHPAAELVAVRVELADGRWDRALDLARRASAGSGPWSGDADLVVALVAARRGELPEAERALAAAGPTAGPVGWSAWVAGLLAEARGEPARALAQLRLAWAAARDAPARAELGRLAPDLARVLAAAGELEELRAVAAALDGTGPAGRVLAGYCRALARDDADGLAAAAAGLRDGPAGLARGLLAEAAALALARAGRTAESDEHATEALTVLAALGAARDVDRVHAELRLVGRRRSRGSTHRRDHDGWASLTPTEERVARLLADGLSNPDIAARLLVSRHTVASHVSRVLGKLGLTRRADVGRLPGAPWAPTSRSAHGRAGDDAWRAGAPPHLERR